MKKLNLILIAALLVATTVSTLSCSSDDNKQDDNTIKTIKTYKKTLVYFEGKTIFDKEFFYDQDKKIKSITINDYDYLSKTFTISYKGNSISTITQNTDYIPKNNIDEIVTYNVVLEKNKAVLTSTTGNSLLEIFFTDGYVNSTKYTPDTNLPTKYSEEVFTRDSNQNLISNTTGTTTFTYSNFDSDKKNDPFGSAMEYEYGDYFDILNLKVTKNNPLTSHYSQGSTNETSNVFLKYDNDGYVIKSSVDSNFSPYVQEHQYIEL